MHKESVIQPKLNNRKKKVYKKRKLMYFSLNILKIGLLQCTKKTPFMCIQHYKIRKKGQVWGLGGESSL